MLLLAIVLAACGGDGDTPSKADFVDQAEDICADAQKRLENVGQDATTPKEISDAVDTVIEETRSSVDELRDLDVPGGDAGETAERFVDALESEVEDTGIPALEDLRDALEDGNRKAARRAVKRLQEIESSASDRFARELGANDCVE
jgi:translation initiation factor 2B subunit (eIF-2B alpha/beta/delta family)